MKKTKFAGIVGLLLAIVALVSLTAAPAQAKDTGWGGKTTHVHPTDTGWG